jgi:autotransporter-associated beta strand protein
MKKLTAIFTVLILATTIKVSAQALVARLTTTGNQPIYSVQGIKEGLNTITLPDGKGTITFTKSGNSYRGVTYVNSGILTVKLEPTRGGTNGAPKPECKSTLPDACFSSADKKIGLCICKPATISNDGNDIYTVRLQMPIGNPGGGTPGH